MQLFCSKNVITNDRVEGGGKKIIATQYIKETKDDDNKDPQDGYFNIKEEIEKQKQLLDQYEKMAQGILQNARSKAEQIMIEARARAVELEKASYAKGYEEGKQNGYEDGYREAYDNNINAAIMERDSILLNANETLKSAKDEADKYLVEKKDDILKLSLGMCEDILKRQVNFEEGMDSMIYDALDQSAKAKTYIIKCNELYVEHLKEKVQEFKEMLGIKDDIFIVKDNSIDEGNAVIEKDNGTINVGIDIALDNIKKELML